MFGRKILFLAAWYVAGNIVSSVYNGSKKKVNKTKWNTDIKDMVDNFISTQKNMISDAEQKYLSDESRKKLAEKKKDFAKYSRKYISQWEKLLEDMQKNENFSLTRSKLWSVYKKITSKTKVFMNELQDEEKLKNKNNT